MGWLFTPGSIRQELIADLPKMRRDGKVLIDGLTVEVEPVSELVGESSASPRSGSLVMMPGMIPRAENTACIWAVCAPA